MATETPRRLTLLYQLYLTGQASRQFMRQALADTGMSGEEYAIFSYLFANGARPLTRAARDLHLPITTLAGLIAPLVDRGEVERRTDPGDRRTRLLDLTPAGRDRLARVIPVFTAAYRRLVADLETAGVEPEEVYEALEGLRGGIVRTAIGLAEERQHQGAVGV